MVKPHLKFQKAPMNGAVIYQHKPAVHVSWPLSGQKEDVPEIENICQGINYDEKTPQIS